MSHTLSSYDWWRRALAGEKIGGPTLPVHEDVPACGFFRRRTSRNGGYIGVAIFPHPETGELVAVQNGERADPIAVWTWVAKYPISEELYREWVQTGKWPDGDSGVVDSLAPPQIGDNNPPQDEADILASQIEAASKNAKEYATITDDVVASKAQSARARLNELSGQADKRREALKKPFLEGGKAIDAKYQPLVKTAKAAADAIARALSAHETRKARAAAEIARKAAEAEADRQRTLREGLAKHPDAPPNFSAPVAPVAPPAEAPKAQIRGSYGKAAAVKIVKVVTMTDSAAAAQYMHDDPEMIALMTKIAQRAANAGIITIPGFTITDERRVQ